MRWVTKQGRLIVRDFVSSPFTSNVTTDAVSQDDRDWNAYLAEKREQLNNPEWDPIQFTDGSSVADWERKRRHGLS